jgi:hypothetical protein
MADYPNYAGAMPMGNFGAANVAMGLSPQEQALYFHHLANLAQGGHPNGDGTTSTLYQMSQGVGGNTYNLPTIYGNAKLSPDDAFARAQRAGLQNFPSYPSDFAAENRYQKMHNYLERDQLPTVANAPMMPFGAMMPPFQRRQ